MPETEGNPVPVRIPDDVISSLDEVSAAVGRSRSWLIVHALRRYLAEHGPEILAAARGAAELDRGDSEDMDDVLRDCDAIIDAAEATKLATLRRAVDLGVADARAGRFGTRTASGIARDILDGAP